MSRLLSRSHTFAIIVILDLKIHQSMWIHWPFFPKTWTKGHWPLDDLWPHVCGGHMCDSTQGSLCPSPMTIHQCMWIQWSILQNTTYVHILHTYTYIHTHTTYRMSDHIVSYWTQSRRDKKGLPTPCFNIIYCIRYNSMPNLEPEMIVYQINTQLWLHGGQRKIYHDTLVCQITERGLHENCVLSHTN